MDTAARGAIGRMVAAGVVIVVLVAAVGIGLVLTSKGAATSTSTSSSSTLSTTSTSSSTTTSSTTSSTISTTNQTTSSSTTTSSTSTSTGCSSSTLPPLNASGSFTVPPFTQCLVPGASASYMVGITDPNGIVMVGAIRAQYAINITMVGAPVFNLTAAGNGAEAFSAHNVTSAGFPDLLLLPKTGYSITVANLSDQNNTVTFLLTVIDEPSFVGG